MGKTLLGCLMAIIVLVLFGIIQHYFLKAFFSIPDWVMYIVGGIIGALILYRWNQDDKQEKELKRKN